MKFSELFESSLSEWPDEVSIADGKQIDDEGGHFPTLSETWNRIELKEKEKTPLHFLMCWAIFSGFHELAMRAIKAENLSEIRKADIKPEVVNSAFNESFHDKDGEWKEYHSDWIDDLAEV